MTGGRARRGAAPLRSVAATALAATAALLALQPVLRPPEVAAGTPFAQQRVGTCHRADTPEEVYLVSDRRPPVPCDQPHDSETVAVRRLPAEVVARPERPGPEELAELAADLPCGEDDVRRHLGSDDTDRHWYVGTRVRFPTRDEWAAGERRFRCDLTVIGRATTLGSLAGIMGRPESAAVRRCLAGTEAVPCDRPHDAEVLGPTLDAADNNPAARARFLAETCEPEARRFLGAAPGDLDLLATLQGADDADLHCVVLALPAGSRVTGTASARARAGDGDGGGGAGG